MNHFFFSNFKYVFLAVQTFTGRPSRRPFTRNVAVHSSEISLCVSSAKMFNYTRPKEPTLVNNKALFHYHRMHFITETNLWHHGLIVHVFRHVKSRLIIIHSVYILAFHCHSFLFLARCCSFVSQRKVLSSHNLFLSSLNFPPSSI